MVAELAGVGDRSRCGGTAGLTTVPLLDTETRSRRVRDQQLAQ
jgi:hypothetical protein